MSSKNEFNAPEPRKQNTNNQFKVLLKAFGLPALKTGIRVAEGIYGRITEQGREETYTRDLGWSGAKYGQFNIPVFDELTFMEKSYRVYDEMNPNDKGVEAKILPMILPIALMEISQYKNIVVTNIQGRNGSIKEYINDSDYNVNLKILLLGIGYDVYPEDEVNHLVKFCKCNETLQLSSYILERFDISECVISNYTYEQVEGTRNAVKFEINLISDKGILVKSK